MEQKGVDHLVISPAPSSYHPCAKNQGADRKRQQRPPNTAARNRALPLSRLQRLRSFAGVFGRNRIPVIVFACDAESSLDQLAVFRQLEEAAVRTRPARRPSSFRGSTNFAIPALPIACLHPNGVEPAGENDVFPQPEPLDETGYIQLMEVASKIPAQVVPEHVLPSGIQLDVKGCSP